jgi:hypothetical protein
VITSRSQLTSLVVSEGANPLPLDLLSADEARELLAHRLGAARVAAEPAAVNDLIARCARLPLALAIVAARAATHPGFALAALAGDPGDPHAGLDEFDGGDPATRVRTVFSWSYQTLSADAARLFRLLGLHPGPDIAAPAAASLAGAPPGQVRPLLAELARAHLITEHAPGRYSFHDLLRAYAAELTHSHDLDTERRAATHRLLDHYLHTSHRAHRLMDPHREPITVSPPQASVTPENVVDHAHALAWLTAEHAVLVAATGHAAANVGFETHAWQLAWMLTQFFSRRGTGTTGPPPTATSSTPPAVKPTGSDRPTPTAASPSPTRGSTSTTTPTHTSTRPYVCSPSSASTPAKAAPTWASAGYSPDSTATRRH